MINLILRVAQMKNEGVMREKRSSLQTVRAAILFVFLLYLAWIGAWLLEQTLEDTVSVINTSQGQFVYWLVMKLMLLVLPAIVVIRYSGRTLTEVMGVKRLKSIILWGVGIGLLLGGITMSIKILGHSPLFAIESVWSFISGVIISPIVEEITFRGAVLGALTQRYRFVVANSLTAFFFLGVHLPGWYFQNRLMNNLITPIGGALSIFMLGFIFGYVAQKSKSVSESIITHMLNNLFSG
jgi:uncharacterized protein